MKTNKIYCKTTKDIPNFDHYAIITGNSYYTPGDQRSIDYPGHGYGASTDYYVEYVAYLNEEDWKYEINELSTVHNSKQFKAIIVKVPTITTKVEVTIK